jgi:hypothetical protein
MIALQTNEPAKQCRPAWVDEIIAHPSLLLAARDIHRWVALFRQDVEVEDIHHAIVESLLTRVPTKKPVDIGAAAYVMGRQRARDALSTMRYVHHVNRNVKQVRKREESIDCISRDGERFTRQPKTTDDVSGRLEAREIYEKAMKAASPKVAAILRLVIREGWSVDRALSALHMKRDGRALLNSFLEQVRQTV